MLTSPITARRAGAFLAVVSALVLAACGGGDDATTTTTSDQTTTTTEAGATTLATTTTIPEGAIVTDSGLGYLLVEEGDGETPEAGDLVDVHYTGMLEDGTVFDSSIDRGEPISFVLGQGAVIAGWDEGIGLMQVGEKAQLIIPPDLGYGATGSGASIPPNATLIFDVELVSVTSAPDAPTEVSDDDYETTATGLQIFDIQAGDGEVPPEGAQVSVHYTGWLEDGTRFDSSIPRGQPFTFTLGDPGLIAGFNEAVSTMATGTIRQVVMPPDLAYGSEGAGGVIPPDATLIFELELIEFTAP